MNVDRILIVGLGSIGRRHLKISRELFPNADIKILRHQKNEINESNGIGYLYSLSEAVNFNPQIAVITSPATLHVSIALALAEIGSHLLIEKPLSADLDGVTTLLQIIKQRKIVCIVGYNLRFLDSLCYYRRLLQNRFIGNIFSVRCEVGQLLPTWRPEIDYRKSVSASRALGGGVLLELSHEIDYLRWIFGEIQWVKATLSTQSNLEIDVEDCAHLVLGFSELLNGKQLIASVNLDFIRHDPERTCLAIGENGSLRWNGMKGLVEFYAAGSDEWRLLFDSKSCFSDPYIEEWKHFLECIRENKMPIVTGNDGYKVLQIIEAARHSEAKNGELCNVRC